MRLLLGFKTAQGPVFIGQSPDGMFHPIWKGRSLGPYSSAAGAINDLARGYARSSDDTDFELLEVSSDIGRWVPANSLM